MYIGRIFLTVNCKQGHATSKALQVSQQGLLSKAAPLGSRPGDFPSSRLWREHRLCLERRGTIGLGETSSNGRSHQEELSPLRYWRFLSGRWGLEYSHYDDVFAQSCEVRLLQEKNSTKELMAGFFGPSTAIDFCRNSMAQHERAIMLVIGCRKKAQRQGGLCSG